MSMVTHTLTITDQTPKAKGFGTILIAAVTDAFVGIKTFSADSDGLSSMIAEGISVDEECYVMASTIISQSPHVATIKIGSLTSSLPATANSFTLTVAEAVVGRIYSIELRAGGGSSVVYSYTAPSGATPTSIGTALAALIDAGTAWSATAVTGVITVTAADATARVMPRAWTRNMTVVMGGAATSYSADLTSINSEDSDWYGLLIDGVSDAQIAAASSWAEANGKIFVACSGDSDIVSSGSADIASTQHASLLHRCGIIPTRDVGGRPDAAAMGKMLSYSPPDVRTWHGKNVSGPRVDSWNASEAGYAHNKFTIAYYEELGIPMLHDGWASSGRYFDLTILADWVVARINEALVALEARVPNIPFNSIGEAMVNDAVSGVLTLAEEAGVIANKSDLVRGWSVTVPKSVNIPSTTRAQRRMPGVRYQFTALGSVHYLEVTGTMGV